MSNDIAGTKIFLYAVKQQKRSLHKFIVHVEETVSRSVSGVFLLVPIVNRKLSNDSFAN